MKKILLLSFILMGFSIHAQKIRVLDKVSLQPLPGVSVFSRTPLKGVATNSKGEFNLDDFRGVDSLSFAVTGYSPLSMSLNAVSVAGKVYLSERSFDLNEVVVSASRFEEKLSEVPQRIETISAKEIETASSPTTAELLQQSGAVSIQKSQLGGGSPIIRGFEANKVLIVIDGIRMNNAIYRGGHLQNVITLDNSVLEKVEIVYGPGSVIYGSDALGGVLHFHTKRPAFTDSGHVLKMASFLRYSSAMDERSGHLDVSYGSKRISSFSSFSFSEFGHLKSGGNRNPFHGTWGLSPYYVERVNGRDSVFKNEDPTLQKFSGYQQYDAMQKILIKHNNRLIHEFNLQFSTSSNIPRYDRLSQLSGGLPRFAEWYYGPQERMLGSYVINYQDSTSMFDRLRISTALQDIQESRHDRRRGRDWRTNRTENVDVYSLNLDFEKRVRKHEIRYGSELTHNDVKSTAFEENITDGETRTLDTRYPSGGAQMSTAAVYLTNTTELSERLILSEGLRLSLVSLKARFNDTTFFKFPFTDVKQQNKAVNGNLGLIFMPDATWRFSAVLSTGFRSPNVDDLGRVFESVPGRVILPNPSVKPEYTYNADLNVAHIFNEKVKFELTGFYTIFKDAITPVPGTFNGADSIQFNGVMSQVLLNTNAAEAYLYGFNADLKADVTNNFSILSNLNYTYGRIKTDTVDYPLDHIPPIHGRTSFILNLKKFRSEFFVVYNGLKALKDYNLIGEDNFANATPFGNPGWYTLNLRTSYQFDSSIQLQVAVENILDEHYRPFASGISAPGRNFIITLRTRI